MNRAATLLLLFLTLGAAAGNCAGADEDIVVVVGSTSVVERLTQSEVTNIFLGRFKKLPSGLRAVPIDVSTLKDAFYTRLVGKSRGEIGAYWARLTFSGQTSPPRQESLASALELVVSMPGAITYVERRSVDKRVKVIFEFDH